MAYPRYLPQGTELFRSIRGSNQDPIPSWVPLERAGALDQIGPLCRPWGPREAETTVRRGPWRDALGLSHKLSRTIGDFPNDPHVEPLEIFWGAKRYVYTPKLLDGSATAPPGTSSSAATVVDVVESSNIGVGPLKPHRKLTK